MLTKVRIDRAIAGEDPSHDPYVPKERDFAGEVSVQGLVAPGASDELELLAVFFEDGARTRPHIHEREQVLYFFEGSGVVVTDSEEVLARPGDVILTPSNTWHWHGAAANESTGLISIRQPGRTEWNVDERDWAQRR
jgi:quercetin dioxygenase-like cupin family protein